MSKRMGHLSVYAYTERKGGARRFSWRVVGSDGAVLARAAGSHQSKARAEAAARRVSGLLGSVFKLKDGR